MDGAFGALAVLSPETRYKVKGLSEADSIAFDFHKWLHVPYDCGCILVRDAGAHTTSSLSEDADYLRLLPRGVGMLPDNPSQRGVQLSRGFRALKVWLALKELGLGRFGRLVAQNVRQGQYLAQLIDESEALKRVAPVPLNIVAFRWEPDGVEAESADKVNRELLMRLQEQGVAVPSSTDIHERFTLRVGVFNHRTQYTDLEYLVRESERILSEILGEAPVIQMDEVELAQ